MWDSASQLFEEAFKKILNGSQVSSDIAFSAAPTLRPYKANITYPLLKYAQENPDTTGSSDCLYCCNGLMEREVSHRTADHLPEYSINKI